MIWPRTFLPLALRSLDSLHPFCQINAILYLEPDLANHMDEPFEMTLRNTG